LTVTALTLAGKLVLPGLPADQVYTKGFAPWWATVSAIVLGGIAVAVSLWRRPGTRRLVAITGGSAAVLLLWSGAGVVLDGFRAFFAVTGIPAGDFAVVDWPGMACRFASLVGCALLAAVTIGTARREAPRCVDCGTVTTPAIPGRRWHGYAAAVLGLPYPALKLYWWAGGTFLRPEPFQEGFPLMELIAMVGGVVLSLVLVQRWGRIFPRWMPLVPGCVVTAILISMGGLSIFGTIAQLLGVNDGPVPLDGDSMWMVGFVYGGWAVFGLALLGATSYFAAETRQKCLACPVLPRANTLSVWCRAELVTRSARSWWARRWRCCPAGWRTCRCPAGRRWS
jgi:hypothetical protein